MEQQAVIVVGASAGGLQALECLVAGLAADFTASVLIVLHIPAHSPSILHTILRRSSHLPVSAAIDGEVMRGSRIYVAPANRHLIVRPGDRLHLSREPRENHVRPAVDALFRSAASTCGERVIGIVLSGSLEDGTAGLQAIKAVGGALVQSPDDAQHPSMPESAIRHVAVDYSLPVVQMPALLATLVARRTARGRRANATPE